MIRINLGCGQKPTKGWKNFDNSPSLYLSRIPFLTALLKRFRFIDEAQYSFISFSRENGIQYADAARKIPLQNGCADAVYSSHMLEHLDRREASVFLLEVYRVLAKGGVLRLAVPDLNQLAAAYREHRNADAFMEALQVTQDRPKNLLQRVKFLWIGARNHQWMYDGESLKKLLIQQGFVDVRVLKAGETMISDPGALDLREREQESVYVEAKKPDN